MFLPLAQWQCLPRWSCWSFAYFHLVSSWLIKELVSKYQRSKDDHKPISDHKGQVCGSRSLDILSTSMVRCWNLKAEKCWTTAWLREDWKAWDLQVEISLTLRTQYQPEFGEGFEYMNHPKPKVWCEGLLYQFIKYFVQQDTDPAFWTSYYDLSTLDWRLPFPNILWCQNFFLRWTLLIGYTTLMHEL